MTGPARRALHQHRQRAVDQGGVVGAGRTLQLVGEDLHPLLLDGGRHVVRPARACGAGARRVGGDVGHVELELAHRAAGLLELLIGLAGEADDDVRGQRRPWQDPADLRDDAAVAVQPVVAVHADQDLVVPGLQRQMHLLGDRRVSGHRLEHLGRHVLRVRRRVVDPDRAPGLLAQPGDAVEQLREAALVRCVGAVGVDVLAEQGDRAVAEPDQPAHLVQDPPGGPRHLAATGIGDRAEGAELVAAVLDRHERGVVGGVARGDLPECVVGAQVSAAGGVGSAGGGRHHPVLADQVGQRRHVGGAHQEVELASQPWLVVRQHAPGDEREQGTLRLPRVPALDAGIDPVDRPLPYRAGDRADQVRVLLSPGPHEPRGVQHRGDPFGVGEVHLAAERHQMVGHAAAEHNSSPPRSTTDGLFRTASRPKVGSGRWCDEAAQCRPR